MNFASDLSAFYIPEGFEPDTSIELSSDEAQHLRALRLREGEHVLLLDGHGHRSTSTVERTDKRSAVVRTGSVAFDGAEAGPYIALSFGLLADKSRIEWCIEKSVELGVRQFLPLETERSEGRLHRSRLERVAVAALKQSQRSWLPEIGEPAGLARLIEFAEDFDRMYVCHESASDASTLAALVGAENPRRALIAIGPEGGFSEQEIATLAKAGGEIVSLGDARLRAETAAIAAVAIVRLMGSNATASERNDHGHGTIPE